MSFKKYQYEWAGVSTQGKKISGILEAYSLNLAKLDLTQQGITLTHLAKLKRHLFKRHLQKIPREALTNFFRQLSTLISAGIPIVQCCQILSTTEQSPALLIVINTIKTHLESGKGLSFSLQQFPTYFDRISFHLIYLSEQTGKLDQILLQLVQHQEKKTALKKQLQQALLYPTILATVATIVTLILLLFVVPRFAELFETMHGTLPFFTRCVIQLSTLLRTDYWLGIIPIVGSFFLIYQFKQSQAFQDTCHRLLLRMPFLGNCIQKAIFARFARNLATTWCAGIPILEALLLVSGTLESPFYEKAVKEMQANIASGQSLGIAMQKTKLFSPFMIQLTQVGEESGQMEQMQDKIASFYEAELDLIVSRLSTLLEPLIITILGVLIGCVVIALYLPIFKLGTVI